MDQYNYFKTEADLKKLVEETSQNGASIEGCLGRACHEYWLDVLDDPYPTSYSLKLLMAMCIARLQKNESLDTGEMRQTIDSLIGYLDQQDICSIESDSRKILVEESQDIFDSDLANKVELALQRSA